MNTNLLVAFLSIGCLVPLSCSDDALLAPGDPCRGNDECEPPDDGVGVCDSTTNVCIQYHFSAEGEPCGGTYRVFSSGHAITFTSSQSDLLCSLNAGLYCDGEACSLANAMGEACNGLSSCEVGTYCDETCRARKSAGEACWSSEECSTELCLNSVCATL